MTVDDPLVEAVHRRDVSEVAGALAEDASVEPTVRASAAEVVRVCDEIGARRSELRLRVEDLLRGAGIVAEPLDGDGPAQTHAVRFRVADAPSADRAAALLAEHGFEPWDRWSGGALVSFQRHAPLRTVAATGTVSSVVRLEWRPPSTSSTIRRVITPTPADWSMLSTPAWAWWLYPAARVVRLISERIGLRRRHELFGPFLATPEALIEPLFDAADLTADDVLVDLGCGDGRLVVTAATSRGCRAIGVESGPDLAARARQRALDAGVDDLVQIVHGDARDADLSQATVVTLFLSLDVVADLVPTLLASLRPGARVIVHEQTRLPAALEPDESMLVLGDGALTVGHRWDVGARA